MGQGKNPRAGGASLPGAPIAGAGPTESWQGPLLGLMGHLVSGQGRGVEMPAPTPTCPPRAPPRGSPPHWSLGAGHSPQPPSSTRLTPTLSRGSAEWGHLDLQPAALLLPPPRPQPPSPCWARCRAERRSCPSVRLPALSPGEGPPSQIARPGVPAEPTLKSTQGPSCTQTEGRDLLGPARRLRAQTPGSGGEAWEESGERSAP